MGASVCVCVHVCDNEGNRQRVCEYQEGESSFDCGARDRDVPMTFAFKKNNLPLPLKPGFPPIIKFGNGPVLNQNLL